MKRLSAILEIVFFLFTININFCFEYHLNLKQKRLFKCNNVNTLLFFLHIFSAFYVSKYFEDLLKTHQRNYKYNNQ